MRVALVLLVVAAAAGCRSASPLYSAQPLTPETVVDGRAGEWPLALRPVPGEAGLSLGLRRDADALVVVVVAGDERQARRIALGGLRFWIDPMGGRDRVLGIRFPAPERLGGRTLKGQARVGRERGAMDDALMRRFEASLDAVEITRGEAEPVRQPAGSVAGLETAATWTERGLVVEMRVPLAARPGLLAMPAGADVGLGVELVEVRRALARQQRGGRPDGPRPQASDQTERPAPALDTVTRWLRIE